MSVDILNRPEIIKDENDSQLLDFSYVLDCLKNELFIVINDFNKELSNNNDEEQKVLEKSKIVRESISNLFNSVVNPYFKKILDEELNNPNNYFDENKDSVSSDIKKLYFYIDVINKTTVNKKILKYNPNYCRTAISEICKEYYRINSFLNNKESIFVLNSSVCSEQTKKRISSYWNDFISVSLVPVVEREFKKVLLK